MDDITTACLVGIENETHWSQTLTSSGLLLVVENIGENAISEGKLFLEKITREIINPPKNLTEFKNFLAKTSAGFSNLTYTVGLVINNILYVSILGNGQMFLKRGSQFGLLLKGSGSVSGGLKKNDLLFFSSDSFDKSVTAVDIKNALSLQTPNAVAEVLAPQLRASETVSAAAVIALYQPLFKTGVLLPKFSNKFDLPLIFKKIPPLNFLKNKRHFLALIIFILVIFLIVSIVSGVKQKQQITKNNEVKQNLELARHEYDEAIALVDLNPIRSRELLKSAQDKLASILPKSQKEDTQTALALQKQITEGINLALKKSSVSLTPFFDLNLTKNGGEGNQMSLANDLLYILDKKNGTIYSLSLITKSAKVVAGADELKTAIGLGGNKNEIYFLQQAVYKVNDSGSLTSVIKNSDTWAEAISMSFYAGNIYILDAKNKQIWKYYRTDTGFSEPQKYLETNVNVDFSNQAQMEINGSIWVVGEGKIMRFTQGILEAWQTKGLDEPLSKDIRIFVSDETKNLYILDRETKKIVVTDKDGEYLSQYAWQDQVVIADFAVSESSNKILLLSRDKIYGIDLK